MKNINLYMVRAGRKAYLAKEFRASNYVGIGWNEIGNLETTEDLNEIKTKLRVAFIDASSAQINNWAGQINRFRFDFVKGDFVISYDAEDRKYYIGQITSDYQFDPELPLHHIRQVNWKSEVLRDSLDANVRKALGPVLSVFRVSELATKTLLN